VYALGRTSTALTASSTAVTLSGLPRSFGAAEKLGYGVFGRRTPHELQKQIVGQEQAEAVAA
jgi:hypothetical protein